MIRYDGIIFGIISFAVIRAIRIIGIGIGTGCGIGDALKSAVYGRSGGLFRDARQENPGSEVFFQCDLCTASQLGFVAQRPLSYGCNGRISQGVESASGTGEMHDIIIHVQRHAGRFTGTLQIGQCLFVAEFTG